MSPQFSLVDVPLQALAWSVLVFTISDLIGWFDFYRRLIG